MGALDYRDKILALADQKPVQPVEIAKALAKDTLLASAMLAEMSEKGLLRTSHLKVGSSPVYYLPAKQEQLLNYTQHLGEKDRKTAALLQEKGVLRDNALDPLTRVSLRNIKDFAKPLDVSINSAKETFWKFYLISDEDAAQHIRQSLQQTETRQPEAPEPKPARQRRPRAKKQPAEQQVLAEQSQAEQKQPAAQVPIQAQPDDEFLQRLHAFFKANDISIIEQVAIKKKNEYDFLLMLPSPVGRLQYYCKAKNKARIAESDISHAFVQGQLKKLPALLISTGTLTKPAQELSKELKGLTVRQV